MEFHHLPVLLNECLEGLNIRPDGTYLDCTLGGAGHSSEIFKRLLAQDAPVFLVPAWMEREKNALKGTVTRLPAREDIDIPVEEHLIVELYSK